MHVSDTILGVEKKQLYPDVNLGLSGRPVGQHARDLSWNPVPRWFRMALLYLDFRMAMPFYM
jgi:hypothetical protein